MQVFCNGKGRGVVLCLSFIHVSSCTYNICVYVWYVYMYISIHAFYVEMYVCVSLHMYIIRI